MRGRNYQAAGGITPSINMAEVPTPRNRSKVGTVKLPGTEQIWENHYQAPDPGQISIPNPGLRTRVALRYHQIHGNPEWPSWGINTGQSVSFTNHFGPYEERANPPGFGTSRVTIGRRQPVTVLKESN